MGKGIDMCNHCGLVGYRLFDREKQFSNLYAFYCIGVNFGYAD